jgi:hypothetical protein
MKRQAKLERAGGASIGKEIPRRAKTKSWTGFCGIGFSLCGVSTWKD